MQLNSDTNHQELASDSTGLKVHSHKTVLTSDTSYKSGAQITCSSIWLTNLGVPMTHFPRFDNSPEQLIELRNILYVYPFIIKDTTQE